MFALGVHMFGVFTMRYFIIFLVDRFTVVNIVSVWLLSVFLTVILVFNLR